MVKLTNLANVQRTYFNIISSSSVPLYYINFVENSFSTHVAIYRFIVAIEYYPKLPLAKVRLQRMHTRVVPFYLV